MSLLEICAVVISFLGIWLTARRQILCWPVSLIACALYFELFLDVRLYADMVLQALFCIAILYGWITWARGKDQTGEVVVEPLRTRPLIAGIAAGAIGAVTIGWVSSHYTNAALPWMDAALTSFSLVAQYWTARRHAASWLLWIIVDTLYVGMFAYKGLTLTAGLYAAMIALAVVGYRRWRKVRAISSLPDPQPGPASRVIRAVWLVIGLFCVALGIIGAFLPLMPTTIFLILAAGCFARSSPRLENWLLNHVHFGPALRAWRANKAIPLYGKIASCGGMAIGYVLFLIGARPGWPLALGVAALMAGCAAYILSRPRPETPAATLEPPRG